MKKKIVSKTKKQVPKLANGGWPQSSGNTMTKGQALGYGMYQNYLKGQENATQQNTKQISTADVANLFKDTAGQFGSIIEQYLEQKAEDKAAIAETQANLNPAEALSGAGEVGADLSMDIASMCRGGRKIRRFQTGGMAGLEGLTQGADLNQLTLLAQQDMNARFQPQYKKGGLTSSQTSSLISGIADIGVQGISNSQQRYSTVSDAKKGTALNVMKGAGTGAQAGMAFGPVGAAVGAVVGGLVGGIGGKNKVRENGFYEDPTIEYGTGIIGKVGRSSAREKYQRMKAAAIGNRNSAVIGQELNVDWNEDYDAELNVFAAVGGNVGDLAWLDDGELFKTPDQTIYEIPDKGRPEDSNLLSIPDGTRVLSDKLKVPGTKETFANMAKRLTSKNKSKYNDKYALGSSEANAINDKIVFDTLFDIQEGMKGGKREQKKGIQEFQLGGESTEQPLIYSNLLDSNLWTPEEVEYALNQLGIAYGANGTVDWNRTYMSPNSNYAKLRNFYIRNWDNKEFNPFKTRYLRDLESENKNYSGIDIPNMSKEDFIRVSGDEKFGWGHVLTKPGNDVYSYMLQQNNDYDDMMAAQELGSNRIGQPIDLHSEAVNYLSNPNAVPITATTSDGTGDVTNPVADGGGNGNGNRFDWKGALGDVANSMAILSPAIADLFARPETFPSVHNPYAPAALNLMGRRRYDVRPALNAIRRGVASSNYAMSQNNTNTGANLAYRLLNAVKANQATNTAYAQAAELNNQYAKDYADALNSFGQQHVAARNLAIDQNAQSRAAARNIRREGLNSISDYYQTRLKDRNQAASDAAMLELYRPLLDAGFTPEQYSKLFNTYKSK